eukprot:SAG11_NODE_2466_length_3324_cov_1.192558_2_plen_120_part_00
MTIEELWNTRHDLRVTVTLVHVPTVTFHQVADHCRLNVGPRVDNGEADGDDGASTNFSGVWPLTTTSSFDGNDKTMTVQVELDGSDPDVNGTMLACRLMLDGDEPTVAEFLHAATLAMV